MLITTFKSGPDLYNLKNNPFIFNQCADARAPEAPLRRDALPALARQHAFAGVGRGRDHAAPRRAGGLRPRAPDRALGRASSGSRIFLTYLVPPTLLFIPLSRVVALLGLQDSLWSIIVVYPSFTIPFSIWLLMGFFKSIPTELEDAAMVDGLTRFQAFIKLVIPISLSGILTVVIFTFTLVTQEFVYALTFISSRVAPDGRRRRPDLPRARRRLLLGLAHGGLPHRQPADRRRLQPASSTASSPGSRSARSSDRGLSAAAFASRTAAERFQTEAVRAEGLSTQVPEAQGNSDGRLRLKLARELSAHLLEEAQHLRHGARHVV